ncbi:type II toxin-antitoxin system RelE/ParE family toxin [Cohnella herbarum]|uniref:Type II toxin-antitoxin system RelE/ParE family toxin n=1 Tax=Cohnella herbarum TaxID=2728023 RepID=A0A7Z2VRV6_9BACL|nr:type II toxin-antitoxin system RelE/ParE family toxin [Cohnella herbarum]
MVEKPLQKAFYESIIKIRIDPYIGELKTGDLAGYYCYDVYYGKTNYEIAYIIEENDSGELVVVILAVTRENFYAELKRRVRKRPK